MALGGILKLVTADNPDLPIRDWRSFHMSGQKDGRGPHLGSENCYWFNGGYVEQCDEINAEITKIKKLIEEKIRESQTAKPM